MKTHSTEVGVRLTLRGNVCTETLRRRRRRVSVFRMLVANNSPMLIHTRGTGGGGGGGGGGAGAGGGGDDSTSVECLFSISPLEEEGGERRRSRFNVGRVRAVGLSTPPA